jgi:hypothetical protein
MSDHSLLSAWRKPALGRRGFLWVSAASATSIALLATGCSTATPTPIVVDPHQLALPAGEKGLLYFTYLMALGKSALYQKVVDSPPSDLPAAELMLFSHMRDHEVVYRELLRYLIDPTRATSLLPTDFVFNLSSFTLTTRVGILNAARQLEDLAAAAYPPILPLFASSATKAILLKMSTVQARHATTVRDLLSPGTFNDATTVDSNGQLITQTPTQINAALAPFVAPYVFSVLALPTPL